MNALDGRASRFAVCTAVAIFIAGFAFVATGSGLRVRSDAWRHTRSIRFHWDVSNGFRWGVEVLQLARAEMPPSGDPNRALPSVWEIVRAEARLYDRLLDRTDGDYQLDYPPVRLLAMSLWVRHVQEQFPFLTFWPGRWRQGTALCEDIAMPLLDLNTLMTWLSCVFSFFLVWLWVDRGGRAGAGSRVSLLGPRRPGWRERTPLVDCGGLLLFPPLLALFFYAMLVVVSPCPAPPPLVQFSGAPALARNEQGVSATVHATINPQGASARWAVDWGTAPGDFSNVVLGDDVGEAGTPSDVSVTLSNLPADATVHYRITARNDGPGRDLGRGMTRTDEGVLLTSSDADEPLPPSGAFGDVWLSLWQWLGIGALFAVLSMSIRWMPVEHRGWACGLLAASLIWLNPAVLMDTHVWPQWDAWVLPPFLLALLLASVEWWFTAGIVFGLGTMFKGQFMIAAPVLLLWPLLSMRWGALVRMILGIALSTGVMVSPWLIFPNQSFALSIPAVKWIVRVVIAAGVAALLPLLRSQTALAIGKMKGTWEEFPYRQVVMLAAGVAAVFIGLIALVLAGWPIDAQLPRMVGLGLVVAMVITPWFIPRVRLCTFVAGIAGVAIWMSAWLYGGDWAWESVGYEYGMAKHDQIAGGQGNMANLPAILSQHFGFGLHDSAVSLHLPDLSGILPASWLAALGVDGNPITLDLREALIALFAALVVACAAGAAIQDRRNHPRFLAAMVAPWMLMPNILGQMMTRYQMWGAAMAALLVAVSRGFVLVCALVSLLAAGMIGNQMLDDAPGRSPQIHQFLANLAPDDGWIMLCMAGLVVVVGLMPGETVGERLPVAAAEPMGIAQTHPDTAREAVAESEISV